MPRIQPVTQETAEPAAADVLQAVQKKLGTVPNIIATLANSTAAAKAYLEFSGALATGTLPARLREQIALTVGEANACDYCVAAHTTLAKRAGLDEDETFQARRGTAHDAAEQAALAFARALVKNRGQVSDDDVHQLRRSGYTDGQIAEIVANVALNLFTNYFNHVADTEVDFPAAAQLSAA